jgi:peptide/nickel transport system ATP-binding protein
MNSTMVLQVAGLSVDYQAQDGRINVVRDVAFQLHRGRILGLAGESGSGKSTAALAAIGWNNNVQIRTSGSSVLDGVDLFALDQTDLRRVWGRRIGYVPQEIGGSLHPAYRIRSQFRETLGLNSGLRRKEADRRAIELLAAARLPDPAAALKRYPHEFSGGQLQRIAIALALAPQPDVLILDEPTTGLDVTTQQTVAGVLRQLVDDRQVAALFITHDLGLLSELADDLAVMYASEIVEQGEIAGVVTAPVHPYTRALLDSVPSHIRPVVAAGIAGTAPGRAIVGRCGFSDRCAHAIDACRTSQPELTENETGRLVRCIRSDELSLVSSVQDAKVRAITDQRVAVDARALTCAYHNNGRHLVAVDSVDLSVAEGSVTALVGESGSGKSTLGRALAGLVRADSGKVVLGDTSLPLEPRDRTRQQRRDIQLIFQNASGSLNPRRTVGSHLEHISAKFLDGSTSERNDAVLAMIDAVQLHDALLARYPGELSGGQRQRVAIAAAFIARPRVVICDEITSGQDVSVQAAILQTLTELQRAHGTSVLFISHDLAVVRSIADVVYVMRYGRIVESARCDDLFDNPMHPYTKELLAAVPVLTALTDDDLASRSQRGRP